MPYIPHTDEETRAMLDCIGVKSVDDLFADIVPNMRPKSFNLPKGKSEQEICKYFEELSSRNNISIEHFLGAGFYDHYIPKAVDALSSRGEFLTAYTPYQPEVSQGTLQAIFEFQSAMARLFDMDFSNASVYDGGGAIFEATMMSLRQTKRKKMIIDEAVNPIWRNMLNAYCANIEVDIVVIPHTNGRSDKAALKAAIDGECAGVIVQNPNFFGVVDDYTDLFAHAKTQKAVSVLSAYPVMQAVIKSAGEMGADIAVADGQSIGMPLSFGGPYLGIMTCTKALIRQMPGRIVGRTQDVDGKVGYVLTLQAREQHIRRSKATSNICSNQALCALRSIIHLSLLGPEGLRRTAEIGMENIRYLAGKITTLSGVKLLNDAPYSNEVAIVLPKKASDIVDAIVQHGFVAGFSVNRYYKGMDNVLLISCTEKNTHEQIDRFTKILGEIL